MPQASMLWDNPVNLDKLELSREQTRGRGNQWQTFDCFNAICHSDRVVCRCERRLGPARDGSIALITVLRGRTSGSCLCCDKFSGDKAAE